MEHKAGERQLYWAALRQAGVHGVVRIANLHVDELGKREGVSNRDASATRRDVFDVDINGGIEVLIRVGVMVVESTVSAMEMLVKCTLHWAEFV